MTLNWRALNVMGRMVRYTAPVDKGAVQQSVLDMRDVLALTMVICAWLIIITVTLKVIWFTLFRILL